MAVVDKIIKVLFGSKHEKDLKLLLPVLHKINEKEAWAINLKNEDFKLQTENFKARFNNGETLDSLLPEAFALVREAARRIMGERHYDVQLLGGICLHQGRIMEMKTGEGKTLSSVTAAYLNAITGKGVHIVTVNDYLAERDANWMRPVYDLLGISVGTILPNMDNLKRKEAYAKDITYATNNELGFDYLRDNMAWSMEEKVQRGHNYCIVDEIDSILIDEARTPLIISGTAEDDTKRFFDVNRLIGFLKECEKDPKTGEYPDEDLVGDYKIEEKNKKISFTQDGMNNVEKILLQNKLISDSLYSEENFEYIHYFTQALRAHKLFNTDVDYVVAEGKVEIVDEFTGRILHGRRYSDGLHQAIEAKENIRIAKRNKTLATITFQNFFRMYNKISGMTGTADTESTEFDMIYKLDVVVIPTNRPLSRTDNQDEIYLNEDFKFEAICDEISRVNKIGQPILVGTVSIEKSEKLSNLLRKKGIQHEVLNAKNHHREALIVSEAGAKGSVTIATNMAGRGTDIKLGGNAEYRARKKAGTNADPVVYAAAYAKELEIWKKSYNEVKSIGGLYILGTERHESRRIDNQLRGRSGRQGDPGFSKFYISLDDDLMRLFGGERMKGMMSRMGMNTGEAIQHQLISNAIEKAQTKVEERNFEIRKHLLDYDNVLNEQRNFIYEQRDNILTDSDLSKRVIDTAGEMIQDIIEDYKSHKADPSEAYAEMSERLLTTFGVQLPAFVLKTLPKPEQIFETVNDAIKHNILEKDKLVGKDSFNGFIRFEYLRNIDKRWQDHLEELEELREAVYLRSYAQKNPLLEYKLEGFEKFDQLIVKIKTEIAIKAVMVQIQRQEAPAAAVHRPVAHINQNHKEFGQFGTLKQDMPIQEDRTIQVTRHDTKVGRNDPCPCGSGKKYKQCHGA